jgi:hypothetical protein
MCLLKQQSLICTWYRALTRFSSQQAANICEYNNGELCNTLSSGVL